MNNPKTKTICITGGHITPALAVMDEIKKRYPLWRTLCIGRGTSIEGSKEKSVERKLVQQKGVLFLPIVAGRLTRTFGLMGFFAFLKIPVGLFQALRYLVYHKPDVVVSFGGYVALPVALAAYLLRIPIITHEQTRAAGIANRMIAMIAKKICLTHEDTRNQFTKYKTVVTGLPMRKEFFVSPKKPPFAVQRNLPIIFVTGGSTGAVTLNDILFPLIEQLTQTYTVIHQTGKLSLPKALSLRGNLPEDQRDRYIVQDFFGADAVSWILHHTSLIVGRSGANTVMEAAIVGKPMICVPLPWSASGEQMENAKWLVSLGLGRIVAQQEALGWRLISEIETAHKAPQVKSIALPCDGASRLVDEISAILAS